VNERQKRRLFEITSTSASMVAPVVVKPETTSNTASIIEGISPESTKGNAPNKDIRVQERETITKPSRA
jgi:hypothetical protein